MDHKDVQIGEHLYRIGQLKAADGSWIYSTFVKRYRAYQEAQPASSTNGTQEAPTVAPEVGFAMTAQFLIEQLSREELGEVQQICLTSCGRYSSKTGTQIAMPILHGDGRYAIADLEFDAPLVYKLTTECVAFNIAPFFPGAGSSSSETPATIAQAQSTQP
jgi:hypothetical protein